MADPVDIPEGAAQPLGPGEPVEHPALSQMGATFAERKAAREQSEQKAVDPGEVENKAVKRSTRKRSASK